MIRRENTSRPQEGLGICKLKKTTDVLAAIEGKGFEATLDDSKRYAEQKDIVRSGRDMSESQLACSTRCT